MEPIYLDLHIHTSSDANHPNEDYDVAELVSQIKSYTGNSRFLISLTDHNMINKSAYLKAIASNVNIIMGAELHIKLHDEVKSYHCHIFINKDITEDNIDAVNKILDELYKDKLPKRDADTIPDIQDIINAFDGYDFMLLPHGSQRHGAFNYSIKKGETVDSAIYRSIYYNQFDGFTARSNSGLDATRNYFEKLGIGTFVNLITCSDNYNPKKYPEPHSDDAEEFMPTWMFAEPTFEGVRLSLSETSRLVYQHEKPERTSEYIHKVKLLNEHIDIDVNLTEGLNVVIGGSSSGKTLFVDSLYKAISHNFIGTKYSKYGVDNLSVSNPSEMKPYYISQNFISENITNDEERSIDKIEILRNIFPGDEEINHKIVEAISNLRIKFSDMFTCVDTIERTGKLLSAIPQPGKLLTAGEIRKNVFLPMLPSLQEKNKVEYPEDLYENDIIALNSIKDFLHNNPLVESADDKVDEICSLLNKAYSVSSLFLNVETIIMERKNGYDQMLQIVQGRNQEHVEQREHLISHISEYVKALKRFNKLKDEIKSTNLSFVTKEVISMGHKLSIQNNFKFDTKVFLESLNKYLNVNFTKLSDVTPSNLNSSKFKSRPRVQSYEDLSNKIHQDLASTNNKSYTIVSKDGNNFTSMSPGWKTAVILDLILGYKNDNAPIIIDQPEDNLAIKYINEDLVKTIKEVKGKKQIILVSHNATIPMMADAQNIIYCKNESGKITIRSAPLEGKLGEQKVLDIIADQTDGGKASIKKRIKKYNFKEYR